jgi:hypothetical protein
MEGQKECFRHENDGIELKEEICSLITGNVDAPFPQPKLGRNTTETDMLEMKYVLELEAATLKEFLAHDNEKVVDIDTPVSASSQVTSSTLSQIAQIYKDSLEESVGKLTKLTVKETHNFVGDVMKMVKHVADDESADKNVMASFMRNATNSSKEALKETRTNKVASTRKSKTVKTPTLNTDRKSDVRKSMKEYGTPRGTREPKAKRSQSICGF